MQHKNETRVRAVFQKMKEDILQSIEYEVCGVKIRIFCDVFSPAHFTDSAWFGQELPNIVGNKKFLEVGSGTGIVALLVARQGGKVTATDINEEAVKNTRYNFNLHGMSFPVYLGDIYDGIPEEEKFDVIFWNHPFNKGDNKNESMLTKAGFDYQYESLEKFVDGARKRLNVNGRLILGSGNIAPGGEIEKIAGKYGYQLQLLKSIETPLTVYQESEEELAVNNSFSLYEFMEINDL